MLSWFSTGPLLDTLYGEQFSLVEAYDFDPELAGAEHAGRSVRSLLSAETARVVLSILADASARRLLAQHMGASPFGTRRHDDQIAVVEAFRRGIAMAGA